MGKVACNGPKVVRNRSRYKWRVDGRVDWAEYQRAVEYVNVKSSYNGLECIEAVWEVWKGKVLRAAVLGIGGKRLQIIARCGGLVIEKRQLVTV